MSLFKRKKKKTVVPEEEFFDEDLKIEEEEINENDKAFKAIEDMQYVRIHCEEISESSKYIEELKNEKNAVESYIMDMQKIEQLPENMQKTLKKMSEEIIRLDKKRKNLHSRPQTLSRMKYARFAGIDDDIPKALTNMQNDEKYCTAVKHDLRILEAEKISLKEDLESYSDRRVNVRNLSIIFLVAMVAVFIIFFISGKLDTNSGRTGFMVVMAIAVCIIALIFFIERRALYLFRLSEKKLARTITLLNKTKIKYVNIVNSVDYQHEKFGVKNAYQFGREYEAYLNDKKNSERYKESTIELDAALASLNKMLDGLKLYDKSVWESQYTAFSDENEWNEIKSGLEGRRRMLRDQINYNIERIDKAKSSVIKFTKKNPNKVKEIMEIVESYDVDV